MGKILSPNFSNSLFTYTIHSNTVSCSLYLLPPYSIFSWFHWEMLKIGYLLKAKHVPTINSGCKRSCFYVMSRHQLEIWFSMNLFNNNTYIDIDIDIETDSHNTAIKKDFIAIGKCATVLESNTQAESLSLTYSKRHWNAFIELNWIEFLLRFLSLFNSLFLSFSLFPFK